MEFEQRGFKKNVRKNVTRRGEPGGHAEHDHAIGRDPGSRGSTSEAPLVETTSTQLGAVVNQRAVSQLPLNARDTYQLLQLQPGVQSQTGSDLFYGSDKPAWFR